MSGCLASSSQKVFQLFLLSIFAKFCSIVRFQLPAAVGSIFCRKYFKLAIATDQLSHRFKWGMRHSKKFAAAPRA